MKIHEFKIVNFASSNLLMASLSRIGLNVLCVHPLWHRRMNTFMWNVNPWERVLYSITYKLCSIVATHLHSGNMFQSWLIE